ncbi:hypothetical protein ACF0H5_018623 [Mactra antiquata]
MALGEATLCIIGILCVGHMYISYMFMYLLYQGYYNSNIQSGSYKEDSSYPLLCYFALDHDWPDTGGLHPAMNATLCSHMIFISSITQDCKLAPADPNDVTKYYNKISLLRKLNPNLKIMISNGGGNFSQVLANYENRTRFVNSIIPFLQKFDFDGLDIDWEFFGWNGLPRQQRENFTYLMQDLRTTFDEKEASSGRHYILSAAVAAGRAVMEIYDVPALQKSIDFINLMCYDFYSYALYDPVTNYNSPLYANDWQKKIVIRGGNIGWSTNEWYKRGMPKHKIMVGIPTYTHTWTLEFPDKYNGLYAPATGPGSGCDECTYAWVCEKLRSKDTTNVWDNDASVPYFYYGNQWVSYDNEKSLKLKSEWIIENGFGGIMVYSLNNDDINGTSCGQGKFPLIDTIKKTIVNHNNHL